MSEAEPLYRRIKSYVAARVAAGEWSAGHRVPSEHELVRQLGASRMTVHRALRELTQEGLLRRVRGGGTFVASAKEELALLQIRNIADEVRDRGHVHDSRVELLRAETADQATADALRLPAGARVFHSVIVHRADGVPVQLEDRYVNPAVAPDYLAVDFARTTPNAYLMEAAPLSEVEHAVEAVMPDRRTCRLLRIGPGEPCLLLHRRTFSGGHVASRAWLTHPGSRYRLGSRFVHDPAATAAPPSRQEAS